jgi:hypothetical protein
MYWWFLMLLVMQLFAQLEMQGIAWVSYRWILLMLVVELMVFHLMSLGFVCSLRGDFLH